MEIINVHTPRGLVLKGAMWGDNTMNTVVIMMSGICSNVFQNELLPATGKLLSENEIAFIAGQAMDAFSFISYSNTVTKTQTTTGVVNDDFSQVYEDVDSYVKYAKELGFKKIILAGHSLGSNKIINYLANTPDDFVDSYIVTAPIDLAHFFDCIKDKKMYLPSDYNLKENIYKSKVAIVDEDSSIMKTIDSNQPVLVIKKGKYIIKGGYCDSKFLLFQKDEFNKFIYIQLDKKGKANVIITDSFEKILFVGTTNGKVFIYEISDNGKVLENVLKLKKILNHHDNSINSMYICNRLNVFATVSKDKTCNLYSYPRMKLFYVIKEDNNVSFDYVFISASPLPSLILYSKHKLMFYIYTINGSFLKKIPNRNKILLTPKITYDNYSRDYLVFGTVDGNLCFIRLPLMEKSFSFELKNTCNGVYYPIKCFDFTEDRQNIYFWQLDNFNVSVLKNGKQKKDANKIQKKTF